VYFIFFSDSGAPKCHGVTYPLPSDPLSMGLPVTGGLAVQTAANLTA